jgi:hypothetical protein
LDSDGRAGISSPAYLAAHGHFLFMGLRAEFFRSSSAPVC